MQNDKYVTYHGYQIWSGKHFNKYAVTKTGHGVIVEVESLKAAKEYIDRVLFVRRNPVKHKSARRPSQVTRKTPTRRLVARRAKNTRKGYFPNPARKKTRSPAQRAATARLVAMMKVRRRVKGAASRVRKNPQSPSVRAAAGRRADRKAIGSHTSRHCIQVHKGTSWLTLAQFPSKAAALDYGRALARKYKTKSIRYFGP